MLVARHGNFIKQLRLEFSTKCKQEEVQCDICHHKLVFKDSSTSSMVKHDKHYHDCDYNDVSLM